MAGRSNYYFAGPETVDLLCRPDFTFIFNASKHEHCIHNQSKVCVQMFLTGRNVTIERKAKLGHIVQDNTVPMDLLLPSVLIIYL